jgi:hypothetical protein
MFDRRPGLASHTVALAEASALDRHKTHSMPEDCGQVNRLYEAIGHAERRLAITLFGFSIDDGESERQSHEVTAVSLVAAGAGLLHVGHDNTRESVRTPRLPRAKPLERDD